MKGPALRIGVFENHPIAGHVDGKQQPVYSTWRAMLARCYNSRHKAYPAYGGAGVTVCEEWHTFQVFAEWYVANYREGWHIEKDLLDGRIYSPETCVFLPPQINYVLKCYDDPMIGVNKKRESDVLWNVKISEVDGKQHYKGGFLTQEAAAEYYQACLRQKMADLVVKYSVPAAIAARLLSL